MKRMTTILALLAALSGLSGCSVLSWVKTKIRVRHAACDAWVRFNECNECLNHYDDIEDGFKEGYREFVYAGGCPGPAPRLPCKYHRYWYRTCFGRQEIEAWREGYLFGQSAASKDCLGCGSCGGRGCRGGCAAGPACGCGVEPAAFQFDPTLQMGALQPAPDAWHATPSMTAAGEPDVFCASPEMHPAALPTQTLPAPPAPAPGAAPMTKPMQEQAPPPTPSARLELPSPTAVDVTPEDAAKDPPQQDVPARNTGFGPAQLRAPAYPTEGSPFEPRPSASVDPRGPQLMSPTDVPGPAAIEAPVGGLETSQPGAIPPGVQTPPISFGNESPGRVSVSNDPFAEPAIPGQPLPANKGWKPLDWKPSRGVQGPPGSYIRTPER